ncbi:hypothetical protein SCNRRL3882_7401 [Streptomyces chartreusis NRRL 3882]|uniref:Uncharacterized protein n=1 Tax=Streptomyces chartreusis NRRL 3882 TaxID=1079985 RepID=A0A2N9BKS0_STRCX|nr:hypothetical protein SCNRRL3882_7401 [Streptomyces chartreusis NRRL 3882]
MRNRSVYESGKHKPVGFSRKAGPRSGVTEAGPGDEGEVEHARAKVVVTVCRAGAAGRDYSFFANSLAVCPWKS